MIALLATLLSLVLVQLPLLARAGDNSLAVGAVSLMPFWLVLTTRLIAAPALKRSRSSALTGIAARVADARLPTLLVVAFYVLQVVSLVRAYLDGDIKSGEAAGSTALWFTVIAFSVVLWLSPAPQHGLQRLVTRTTLAVGVFLAANLVLFSLGFGASTAEGQGRDYAEMLGAVGINILRHGFPLGSGINGIGIMGGAGLLLGSLQALRAGRRNIDRLGGLITAILGGTVLLQTDSRAALLFALLTIVLTGVLPFAWLRVSRWAPIVVPLAPLVILRVVVWLNGASSALLVARGSSDFATANGRQLIWAGVAAELSEFRVTHLFGFGFLGTYRSGVVNAFAGMFSGVFEVTRLTAHNVILQYVLDVGYVGAALFVLLTASALSAASSVKSDELQPAARAICGGLVFFVFAGTTESCPSMYQRENFFLFLFLVIGAFAFRALDRERDQEEHLVDLRHADSARLAADLLPTGRGSARAHTESIIARSVNWQP